jgi:hypothetical protein
MAKPLRSQLNQIRAWVRQGRTDAWIAHQLDVSTSELREFRRRHELDAEEEGNGEADLRDEIEAEIEAATRDEEEAAAARAEEEAAARAEEAAAREEAEATAREEDEAAAAGAEDEDEAERAPAGDEDADQAEEERPRRRRRRRRAGRGRRGGRKALQATFDHGDADGYGLWLDPAVKDDPIYGEHWAGARRIEVTIEPDQIVIRRSEPE